MTTLPPRIALPILLCIGFFFSADRGFEAKASPAPRPEQCKKVVFSGSVNGGEPYSRELGSGLTLKLIPLKDNWGWEIQVRPHDSNKDYAYPLNPPLRGGNAQYLGTGYGITAREQLSYEHEVRFLLMPTISEYSSSRAMRFGLIKLPIPTMLRNCILMQ